MVTQNKKSSFISKIIPNSKKSKILASVAIFAVIGGGLLVYKSFAATIIRTWNESSYISTVDGAVNGIATRVPDTVIQGKNPITVFKLPTNAAIIPIRVPNQYASIPGFSSYQYCVNARGVGAIYLKETNLQDGSFNTYRLGLSNGSIYQDYCGNIFKNPLPTAGTVIQPDEVRNVTALSSNSAVFINSISVKTVDPPTAVPGK